MNYISIILFVIFASCVATLWTEGMWGNAVQLINVMTAALLATNYFEPLAQWLQELNDNFYTFTYLWDFLALWGLFVFFMVVFRYATDKLSKVRVKFLKPVNQAGGFFFAAWIGWIMVCFTAVSLHVAPMGREYLVGHFKAEPRVESMFSPEICWLGFVAKESEGAFCCMEPNTFDPLGQFLPKYTSRRANLEFYNKKYKAIRINPAIKE